MPTPTGTSGGGPTGGLPVGTKAPKAKEGYTYTPWVQDPNNKLHYERVGTKTVTAPGKKVTKFAKDNETYLASFKNQKDQGLYNKYKNDPNGPKGAPGTKEYADWKSGYAGFKPTTQTFKDPQEAFASDPKAGVVETDTSSDGTPTDSSTEVDPTPDNVVDKETDDSVTDKLGDLDDKITPGTNTKMKTGGSTPYKKDLASLGMGAGTDATAYPNPNLRLIDTSKVA